MNARAAGPPSNLSAPNAMHRQSGAVDVERDAPKTDPVCGMSVPVQSDYYVDFSAQRYVFCSGACRAQFLADPHRFAHQAGVAAPSPQSSESTDPRTAGTIYTCPMHPQIRRNAPGNCPICGMTLEPLRPTAEVSGSSELRAMTRRFWIGTLLSAPLVVWEMGGHALRVELHHVLQPQVAIWLELLLGSPGVLWAGAPSSRERRHRAGLLRGRRRHHGARAPRPSPRTACS